MIDPAALQAAVDKAVAAAAKMTTTGASAASLLRSQKEIIKEEIRKAIEADDAIDNANIAKFAGIVDSVTGTLTATETDLGAAVTENTTPAS